MRHYLSLFLILSFLCSTPLALAHGDNYFENAPDAWASHRHAASGTAPSEYFQTADDIELTGVDLWMDNTGSSGSVTVSLLDDESTTLSSKTISVSNTGLISGGRQFHLDFPETVSIENNRVYSIKITSSMAGLGIYYSELVQLLGHNQTIPNTYAYGQAYLGSNPQNFTFKFALYVPEPDANPPPPPPPTPAPAPSSTVPTTISNARIVSATSHSVTVAWTTNVAANSHLAIRAQTSPLYVLTSTSDLTLELEHTLTISDLGPSTYYFADIFSQQNPSEPLLTTYTISFQTLAGSVPPPAPTPTPTPTPAPNPTAPPPISAQTPPSPSQTLSLSPSGGGTTVQWEAPNGEEPVSGYRIDVFDEHHQLVRQIVLPPGTHDKEIALLAAGNYSIVVYANNNGVFTKIASPAGVAVKKPISPIIWFWSAITGIIILVLVVARFAFKREKTTLPDGESSVTGI